MYLKLMINGIASDPFSARGLAPLPEEEKTGNVEKVIKVTRERYAKEKSVVEDKIMRWHENDGGEDEKEKPAQKRNNDFVPVKRPVERTVFEKKPEERTVAEAPKARIEEKRDNPKNKEFEVICSRCNQPTKISFQPDGIRPVYCKDCLSFLREEKKNEVELRKKSKQEELKRIDEQEKNVPKSQQAEKEISLGELSKIEPVGFKDGRGNGFKNDFGKKDNERNINEGEDILIKN
jgi:CxxC-x17-CxxC domain-containing protein